mmetsp:Transcript_124712/g.349289  ORF Transcript_124712/g.349289 Transcript_124712/m.349289 type:complete len:416 (-) Transcript_124712:210-1457(-)
MVPGRRSGGRGRHVHLPVQVREGLRQGAPHPLGGHRDEPLRGAALRGRAHLDRVRSQVGLLRGADAGVPRQCRGAESLARRPRPDLDPALQFSTGDQSPELFHVRRAARVRHQQSPRRTAAGPTQGRRDDRGAVPRAFSAARPAAAGLLGLAGRRRRGASAPPVARAELQEHRQNPRADERQAQEGAVHLHAGGRDGAAVVGGRAEGGPDVVEAGRAARVPGGGAGHVEAAAPPARERAAGQPPAHRPRLGLQRPVRDPHRGVRASNARRGLHGQAADRERHPARAAAAAAEGGDLQRCPPALAPGQARVEAGVSLRAKLATRSAHLPHDADGQPRPAKVTEAAGPGCQPTGLVALSSETTDDGGTGGYEGCIAGRGPGTTSGPQPSAVSPSRTRQASWAASVRLHASTPKPPGC